MRHLRQLCLITALLFTFTFSVYAGEIECPGVTAKSQPTVAGEIPNDITNVLLIMLSLI
jgi:hypothetical protein